MLQLAQPSDREAVNALAVQIHGMHISWRPDLFQAAEELFPRDRYEELIRHRQLYVAKLGQVVVGYTLLRMVPQSHIGRIPCMRMVVEEFCVDASCRSQGIGRQMMEDIHALAKAFGCTDLQLSVYPQNDAAVSFYQKCGFTIQYIQMQKKV